MTVVVSSVDGGNMARLLSAQFLDKLSGTEGLIHLDALDHRISKILPPGSSDSGVIPSLNIQDLALTCIKQLAEEVIVEELSEAMLEDKEAFAIGETPAREQIIPCAAEQAIEEGEDVSGSRTHLPDSLQEEVRPDSPAQVAPPPGINISLLPLGSLGPADLEAPGFDSVEEEADRNNSAASTPVPKRIASVEDFLTPEFEPTPQHRPRIPPGVAPRGSTSRSKSRPRYHGISRGVPEQGAPPVAVPQPGGVLDSVLRRHLSFKTHEGHPAVHGNPPAYERHSFNGNVSTEQIHASLQVQPERGRPERAPRSSTEWRSGTHTPVAFPPISTTPTSQAHNAYPFEGRRSPSISSSVRADYDGSEASIDSDIDADEAYVSDASSTESMSSVKATRGSTVSATARKSRRQALVSPPITCNCQNPAPKQSRPIQWTPNYSDSPPSHPRHPISAQPQNYARERAFSKQRSSPSMWLHSYNQQGHTPYPRPPVICVPPILQPYENRQKSEGRSDNAAKAGRFSPIRYSAPQQSIPPPQPPTSYGRNYPTKLYTGSHLLGPLWGKPLYPHLPDLLPQRTACR